MAARDAGDPKTRGRIASDIYRRLAVPSFVLSFVCGAIRLGEDTKHYLKDSHWMHAKLLFALIVIALHHVIGARAKKLAATQATPDGSVQGGRGAGILAVVLGLAAIGAAFFAIFKIPM